MQTSCLSDVLSIERSGMRAVAIVSGGMDSVTLAYKIRRERPDHELHLIGFNYGQRHSKELHFAEHTADVLRADFDCIDLEPLGSLLAKSGSSLVDMGTSVPEGHYEAESMRATVVPNRNAIMISIATGIAVAEKADCVALGVHSGDHAIYPDCRPQFIQAMDNAMYLGNESFVEPNFHLYTPFLRWTKAEIASEGDRLHVDFSKTWSCYKGGDKHCGKCGTCVERREALSLAGVVDPTEYE
jgi:7-cyano-7-deazaguanine synthase